MKMIRFLALAPLTGLLVLTACKSPEMQMTNRPSFLSTYNHLRRVDDLNLRYVSPPLLGQCNRFIVSPVKVLFTEFDGKPITAEQRQKTADYVRQTMIVALSDRYPVVTEAGPDVGEIRLALTGGYRTAGKLGLCVEGEILDNSNTQVAAVMHTELSESYVPDWENKASARQMVGDWGRRLRNMVDEAHAK